MEHFWDDRYLAKDLVWGAEPNQFVVSILDGYPPGRVLDLACGEGRNAIWLATRGHDVLGIDISGVAIERARSLAADAGVTARFEKGDVLELDLGQDQFDLVVLSYLQLPPEVRTPIHRLVKDALAPGGRVVVVAHHRDNIEHGYGGPQDPAVCFIESELAGDFEGLAVERNDMVKRTVDGEDGPVDAIDLVFIGRKASS